jgi:Cu-processing system permease protein
VLPLFSVIFATSYYYNAYEFTELVLGQPVKRIHLFASQFSGVALAMVCAFVIGCGIPVLLYVPDMTGIMLVISGITLTLVFVSLAFLAGVLAKDKARGIGIALLLWFYFVFLYDAIVLMLLFAFSNYPMENFMMIMAFLNPVDLIRIIMLMHLDMAAIMGYTGAVFSNFLGSQKGTILCFAALFIWIALPLLVSTLRFRNKDI